MTSLEERVARAVADAFPSAGRGSSTLKTQPIDLEAATDLARAAIAVCAEEMARRIEEGFDRPVDKPYRTDGIPSKNDQCPHGAYMYESCDACCAAAIRSMGERGC